ncbi:hypothetical protein HELRODRAFT_164161 [Helobdella robusta]|uniref:Uncharacterized protein n=1 Tax=Helobdella robusta TaxID=6412 RepID=T1EV08_HELRO|nr:hypothetical protein HELRODRAFT_164161 [Helobdella robusta]ESN94336.1 hypothetical protein HELRODRAFT_164161 [Helobdella robusta]
MEKLYLEFKDNYIAANPNIKKELAFKNLQKLWNECKSNLDEIKSNIIKFKAITASRRGKMMSMWSKAAATKSSRDSATTSSDSQPPDVIVIPMKLSVDTKNLLAIRKTGLWTDEMKKNAEELEVQKKKLKQKLNRLKFDRNRKRLARAVLKSVLESVITENPDVAKKLKKFKRKTLGRPSIETDQSDLLKSIIDIVTASGAADDRRRTELIRSCKTLDDLHSELTNLGYNLSRSAIYIRLLPRNYLTTEGKWHISTVPVKLIKAANSLRKEHPDAHFAASTISYLKDLAVLMGSHCTFFLSQDDKARVVADRHKLIPSVYAGCVIKDGRATYSGPTMISIRSSKHDKSSAATHVADFNTHAPGHSAYNAVERRMAPLSHDLSGLILPYDYFGSHLDTNSKTIDPELKKLIFTTSKLILTKSIFPYIYNKEH